ncbi:MAG: RNA methyltransferase [Bdellovibrionota bacterium]
MRVSVGLVHYPIYDRARNVVATNITNLDIHDISRACRVYGIERYYLIHPMKDQLSFVHRILDHWRVGDGAKYNTMRAGSLNMVHTAESLDAAISDWGGDVKMVATHARDDQQKPLTPFKELRARIEQPGDDKMLLLFGTGTGLTEDVIDRCEWLLEPIKGASKDDYRHLSVRSAASICLDRLLGSW